MHKLKIIFILISLFCVFTSCNDVDTKPRHAGNDTPSFIFYRAVILENNTISYCKVPERLKDVYYSNDSVWLNLATHTIDDTSANTMRAVLQRPETTPAKN